MDRASYRHNLEYRAALRGRRLELTQQLLSGELGTVAAARALVPVRDAVEPEIGAMLDVFAGIDSETDPFPLGEVRQGWSPQALEREDLKMAAAERFWHDKAMDTGAKLRRLSENRLD